MFDPSKELLIAAHRPTWKTMRMWLLFTGCLALAQTLIVWSVNAGNYLTAALGVLLTAHFMHSQLMAFHEACARRALSAALVERIDRYRHRHVSLQFVVIIPARSCHAPCLPRHGAR
ncbi:MAG: hypothetical protein QM775_22975 [Pirellulales bacterium]